MRGYSGIALHRNAIIVLDSAAGTLWRFDARAARGVPMLVPLTPATPIVGGDAIRLPPRYDGHVLLVAEHTRGVSVLRPRDGRWTAAEYLGLVPIAPDLPAGAMVISVTQIGDSIYTVVDWLFGDPIVPGTVAGNRSSFPMVDITSEVELLLRRR